MWISFIVWFQIIKVSCAGFKNKLQLIETLYYAIKKKKIAVDWNLILCNEKVGLYEKGTIY